MLSEACFYIYNQYINRVPPNPVWLVLRMNLYSLMLIHFSYLNKVISPRNNLRFKRFGGESVKLAASFILGMRLYLTKNGSCQWMSLYDTSHHYFCFSAM